MFRVGRVFALEGRLLTPPNTLVAPQVRRAKLYYLRDRVGKAAKLKQTFTSKSEAEK